MCCLFCSNRNNFSNRNNCCGCQRRTNSISPRVIVGPAGPQGPAGTSNAVYATSATQTVAPGSIIPLVFNNATPQSTFTVSGNSIFIPTAGTYLVSYFVDGSVADGSFVTTLYLNGSPLTNEVITQTNSANGISAGSKTALITVTAPSSLAIYNTSAETATLTNASLLVLKVA